MPEKIEVAFLILNYKSYRDTIRVGREIQRFDDFPAKYYLVIVDNASPNESFVQLTQAFAQNANTVVLQSGENGGYAKGNNFGLRWLEELDPQYVCVMNNDVYFDEGLIRRLVAVFPTLPAPAFISPLQRLPDGRLIQPQDLMAPKFKRYVLYYLMLRKTRSNVYMENTSIPNIQRVNYIPGAFLFGDYNKFRQIGYFDERTFLFGEEQLLGHRVQEAGLNNYLLLNERYLHNHSKTINTEISALQQWRYLHRSIVCHVKSCCKFPRLKTVVLQCLFPIRACSMWLSKLYHKCR